MVFTAGFRLAASPPSIAGAAPYYSNNYSNNTHTHQQQQQQHHHYNQQYAARPSSKKYGENYSKQVWEYISARPTDEHKVENTKSDRKTTCKHEQHLPRAPAPTDKLDLVRLPRSPSPGYSSQAQSRGPSRAPSPQRHRSSAGEHRRSERTEARPPHRQRMNDKAQTPREYWGYLITRDEKPQATPKLKGLLSAIAEYVIENMEPRDVNFLSPDKLAAFYRQVGGDLDDFLIHTPPSRISEIYTTLGCAHSLQSPPNDDFQQPTIPVLSTRGFQTWQTIQLLLEPAEHVAYLQNAVETFDLRDPETGEPFPKEIPTDAFPTETDQVTFDWHEECFSRFAAEKAKREAEASGASAAPTTAPHSTTATAGTPSSIPVPPSEDDYYTRPKRRHQKRRPTYADDRGDPDLYPRSVPAGYTHERRSSRDPPREHHSHRSSHSRDPTPRHHSSSRHRRDHYPDFLPPVETPAASDFEDDEAYLSGRKYAHIQPHSRGHSHSRHDYGSRSRSRRTSREYLPEVIPIIPVDPYANVVEPVASYIRPEHVVYTHAPPPLDYTDTEGEDSRDRDVRSRFLRRSTSPLRAPLGGSSSQGGRVHKAYREEYVAPYDPYEQAELAAQAEQMLHIKELEERKRRKEERRVRDSYKSEWGYERERERGRRGEAAYGY